MTLSPRRNLSADISTRESYPHEKANPHLADEPVLVHRTALLAVVYGSLGPHLFLLAENQPLVQVLRPAASCDGCTDDILQNPIKPLASHP